MIKASLSSCVECLQGTLLGEDVSFEGISTDTRTLQPGNLFIALTGPQFDGHDFIEQAQAKGAAAVMVSRQLETTLPCLQVNDTRVAYGRLARWHRQQHNIPVIAITGSMGKTTTKEMLATILQQAGPVLATQANENNDVGVPLTLLRLEPSHRFAVIEMGADKFGEIDYVTRITQPNIAVLTCAAPIHIEGFGDLAGVAHGKGEIFNGLSEDGVAIINRDDDYAEYWQETVGERKTLCFGLHQYGRDLPEVTARHITLNDSMPQFLLITPQGEINIQLQLMGRHNVYNAIAATAAAIAAGASLEHIKTGLEATQPYKRRLVKHRGKNDSVIIDDTYNAGPHAVAAALGVLASHEGEKMVIFGDMRELAGQSEAYHRQVGEQARQLGIEHLLAVGEWSRFTVEAFGETGKHFASHDELIAAAEAILHDDMVVLVKGSHGSNMGTIAEALVQA